MKTKYRVEGLFGSEFPAICNHCGVMTAWSRKTWKFCEQVLRFFEKTTHHSKIFEILFPQFTWRQRLTLLCNLWEIGEIVRYLLTKNIRPPLKLSLKRGSRIESAKTSPQHLAHNVPDFLSKSVHFRWSYSLTREGRFLPIMYFHESIIKSFERVEISNTTLLGAPLLPGPALDHAWDKRYEELTRAVDRLSAISSQDGLILLRSAFSAPKVLHLLRCSPSDSHPSLVKFDTLLRRSIQSITNSNLTDSHWIQSTRSRGMSLA